MLSFLCYWVWMLLDSYKALFCICSSYLYLSSISRRSLAEFYDFYLFTAFYLSSSDINKKLDYSDFLKFLLRISCFFYKTYKFSFIFLIFYSQSSVVDYNDCWYALERYSSWFWMVFLVISDYCPSKANFLLRSILSYMAELLAFWSLIS
jgi:hypothetical protein